MAGFRRLVEDILVLGIKVNNMKITKNDLLMDVTNLIINPAVKEEERQILITYKNNIEESPHLENNIMNLSNELRLLAVKNISSKEKMSISVNEFYKKYVPIMN
ncbi:bacteriocin immunity protein [Streptococcus porcinus]|uniref:bacteriocin immunity protein n=1 Tax=Streptococcus porcinus TaxID=1340 RepID=UPI00215DA2B1|nr:bacteriocin immunity protein [Streptococcus porcinus]